MKLHRFCAKCGKTLDKDDKIYDGFLCHECFGFIPRELHIPKKIQLRRCVYCKSFSLKKNDQELIWQYKPEHENDIDFITRILYDQIFDHLEKKYNLEYDMFFRQSLNLDQEKDIDLHIQVKFQEDINPIESDLPIKIKVIHCPYCASRQGGRFNAIVQIRIQHSNDEKKLKKIMKAVYKIDKKENFERLKNFISKVESTTNGYDLKVSTNAMARVLVSKLSARYHFEKKKSRKLIGVNREDGSDLYRQSTLLRLVPVNKKDRINIEGKDYIVKKTSKNKITLKGIHDDKVKLFNFDTFQNNDWYFLDDQE